MFSSKSQVSVFFIAMIATLIGLAFIVISVGKTAKDKTHADNAADGGALSGGSVMAYAFNYVANANAGEPEKNFKDNWNDIKKTYTKHFDHAKNQIYETRYKTASKIAQEQTCGGLCGPTCFTITGTAHQQAKMAAQEAQNYRDQIEELIRGGFQEANSEEDQKGQEAGVLPNAAHLQQAFLEAVRERVHDDQEGQDDLYQIDLSTAYLVGFQNSGIAHRLGRATGKKYEQFLKQIRPETVRNGGPKTFSWVDGAGRAHWVTVIVNVQDARTYVLKKTQMDRNEVKQKLDEAKKEALKAKTAAEEAAKEYAEASKCCRCCSPCLFPCNLSGGCPLCCPEQDIAGDSRMREADLHMQNANRIAEEVRKGLDQDASVTTNNKDGSEPYIIKHIKDIQHNRQVQVSTFQFHSGGLVKSLIDTDVMTFYPPVQSSTIVSFQGNGDIENGKASHDSEIQSVF